MALNALMVDPGRAWKNSVWRWYSEDKLDCCVPLHVVKQQGITFDEFVCLARCNGLNVADGNRANKISIEEFRAVVKNVSTTKTKFLALSYDRKALGQTGSGHFSPCAGYNEEKDMLLILDVARFKYPPHWVKLQTMYKAMCGIDSTTGKPRGYILLERAATKALQKNPALSLFTINLSSRHNAHKIISDVSTSLMKLHPETCSSSTDIDETFSNVLPILSKASNLLQYVYVVRKSSCCTLSSAHLKLVNDMKYSIEQTYIWQYCSTKYAVLDDGTCECCNLPVGAQHRLVVIFYIFAWDNGFQILNTLLNTQALSDSGKHWKDMIPDGFKCEIKKLLDQLKAIENLDKTPPSDNA